ncbi:MAG: hypothetical protein M0Q14_03560 [Tissierellaceae bacterium]|nr:hypothetical protein [Tissierellaceae bacterium]
MSIKPIDYNVMLPKTQEISSIKHVESEKHRNVVESTVVQHERDIDRNKKRVIDLEKSSEPKIKREDGQKNQNMSSNKKKKKDKRKKKDEETDSNKGSSNVGNNIDIHI